MRDQTISDFLERLAGRVPAPGGGASAALHAAQAAALLGMVARYSDGPGYAGHEQVINRILAEADALRDRALRLAEDDAAAFTAVTDSYRLPKATDEEKAARSAAIAGALAAAAEPPSQTIAAARRLVELAGELLPVGNRNVITDVAAAAEAARAAATTARVNVEVNLGGIKDEEVRAGLAGRAAGVDEIAAEAERVTAAVREEISR
ncbi:cyclodeaminase/cyclohydrolase family protein [Streptosporangium canum]|uniref:cyclodeaminase/cyclohydrolase family protein n=1 Tax=Streptosporangium canum TaxID=324952 RepID=UPI0036CD80A4